MFIKKKKMTQLFKGQHDNGQHELRYFHPFSSDQQEPVAISG